MVLVYLSYLFFHAHSCWFLLSNNESHLPLIILIQFLTLKYYIFLRLSLLFLFFFLGPQHAPSVGFTRSTSLWVYLTLRYACIYYIYLYLYLYLLTYTFVLYIFSMYYVFYTYIFIYLSLAFHFIFFEGFMWSGRSELVPVAFIRTLLKSRKKRVCLHQEVQYWDKDLAQQHKHLPDHHKAMSLISGTKKMYSTGIAWTYWSITMSADKNSATHYFYWLFFYFLLFLLFLALYLSPPSR